MNENFSFIISNSAPESRNDPTASSENPAPGPMVPITSLLPNVSFTLGFLASLRMMKLIFS